MASFTSCFPAPLGHQGPLLAQPFTDQHTMLFPYGPFACLALSQSMHCPSLLESSAGSALSKSEKNWAHLMHLLAKPSANQCMYNLGPMDPHPYQTLNQPAKTWSIQALCPPKPGPIRAPSPHWTPLCTQPLVNQCTLSPLEPSAHPALSDSANQHVSLGHWIPLLAQP